MRRVRYINKVCNCIGHVISKIDGSKYYLLQGSKMCMSYKRFETKEEFLDTLDSYRVYIDIEEINLNSRYTWAEDYLVLFLPSTLMETE